MNRFEEMFQQARGTLYQWRELDPGAHLYVLLDGNCPVARDHGLHPLALDLRTVQRQRALVQRSDLADTALWPQLLQVYQAGESGYVDEPLVDQLIAHQWERRASVNGAYVAGWLCSSRTPEKLAETVLRRAASLCLSQGRQRLVPVFQPHVLSLLMHTPHGGAFAKAWLGEAARWGWCDATGVWHTLDGQSSVGPSRLAEDFWQALDQLPVLRLCLMALRRAGIELDAQAETRIHRWLLLARARGLNDRQDQLFFALNCASLPAQWHEHATTRRLIDRCVGDPDLRLAALFDELSDDQLDELGAPGPLNAH